MKDSPAATANTRRRPNAGLMLGQTLAQHKPSIGPASRDRIELYFHTRHVYYTFCKLLSPNPHLLSSNILCKMYIFPHWLYLLSVSIVYSQCSYFRANRIQWTNVGVMPGQRNGEWANIDNTSCFLWAVLMNKLRYQYITRYFISTLIYLFQSESMEYGA